MGFLKKRQLVLMCVFCAFLWSLYAFSSGNADFDIHQRRFYNYQELASQTEWIYSSLMRLFNQCGLDYRAFLIFDSLFVLLVYYRFVNRNTRFPNIVLSLYMIFPFCLDVTMVRYTLAFSVVLCGLDCLWKSKSIKKYLCCVFIAFFIHSSMILMLLFLLPCFYEGKKLKRFFVIALLGWFLGGFLIELFLNSSLMKVVLAYISNMSLFNIGEKSSIVLESSQMKYGTEDWIRYGSKIFISFGIMCFIFFQIKRYIKGINDQLSDADEAKVRMIDFASGLNLVSLLIIPLIVVSADVFRLQLSLSIVFYVAVANYLELKRKYSPSKNNLLIVGCILIYSLFNLYMWVLGGPNMDSVWIPLFSSNVLWG